MVILQKETCTTQTAATSGRAVLNLENLSLDIVSDFEIRASDLRAHMAAKNGRWVPSRYIGTACAAVLAWSLMAAHDGRHGTLCVWSLMAAKSGRHGTLRVWSLMAAKNGRHGTLRAWSHMAAKSGRHGTRQFAWRRMPINRHRHGTQPLRCGFAAWDFFAGMAPGQWRRGTFES